MAVAASRTIDEVALYAMFRARRHKEYTETHPIVGLDPKYERHLTSAQRDLYKSLAGMSEIQQLRTVNMTRQRLSTLPPDYFRVVIRHRATDTYFDDFLPEFYRTYRTFEEWGKRIGTETKFPTFHTDVVNGPRRQESGALADFVTAFLSTPFVAEAQLVGTTAMTLGEFTASKMERANKIFTDSVLKKSAEIEKALEKLDTQFRKNFSPRGRDENKFAAIKKLRDELKAVTDTGKRSALERAINDLKVVDPYLEFEEEDLVAFGTLTEFMRRYDELYPKFYVASGGGVPIPTSGPVATGGPGVVPARDLANTIRAEYQLIQSKIEQVVSLRKAVEKAKAGVLSKRRVEIWNFYCALGDFFSTVPDEFTPCCERKHHPPPPKTKTPEPEEEEEEKSQKSQESEEESEDEKSQKSQESSSEESEEEEEDEANLKRIIAVSTKATGYYRNVDDNRVRFTKTFYLSKFSSASSGATEEERRRHEKSVVLARSFLNRYTTPPAGFLYDEDANKLIPIVPLLHFTYVATRVFPDFVTALFIEELQKYADDEHKQGKDIEPDTKVKAYLMETKEFAHKRVRDLKDDEIDKGVKKTKLWTPVYAEDTSTLAFKQVEYDGLIAKLRAGKKREIDGQDLTTSSSSSGAKLEEAKEILKTTREKVARAAKKSPQ